MAENKEKEDGAGRQNGEPAGSPVAKLAGSLAEKLKGEIKVEKFSGPKIVKAVAAVSFKGDTVYCTDKGGLKLADTAVNSLAVLVSCILVSKMTTPEGILELLGMKNG